MTIDTTPANNTVHTIRQHRQAGLRRGGSMRSCSTRADSDAGATGGSSSFIDGASTTELANDLQRFGDGVIAAAGLHRVLHAPVQVLLQNAQR